MNQNWKNYVYKHIDYKDFIKLSIESNKTVKAYRARLAEGAGCQRTFLSSVLHSHIHLTPEHAIAMSKFWEMDLDQTEFFLSLVLFGRAGSAELKKLLMRRLDEIRSRKSDIERTINSQPKEVWKEEFYYSDWRNSALHMLVGVPRFQNLKELSIRLGETPEIILKRLKRLEKIGCVEEKEGKWQRAKGNVHVQRSSPLYTLHHINWRNQSLSHLLDDSDSIHFTGIHSLSKKDFERLKEFVFELLTRSKSMIDRSAEEEVICLNIDLFVV